jgi:hypothetical protein
MKKILICLIILGLMGLVTNGCKKETKLKIDTIPSNAMLYINSQYKGKTPININLFPG